MKYKYTKPGLTVSEFDREDIITVSGDGDLLKRDLQDKGVENPQSVNAADLFSITF